MFLETKMIFIKSASFFYYFFKDLTTILLKKMT